MRAVIHCSEQHPIMITKMPPVPIMEPRALACRHGHGGLHSSAPLLAAWRAVAHRR